MSRLQSTLACYAAEAPHRIALEDSRGVLTYGELWAAVEARAQRLRQAAPRALALLADNGRDWALIDLAALAVGYPLIPIPPYFSAEQIRHVLDAAGVDLILTDRAEMLRPLLAGGDCQDIPWDGFLSGLRLPGAPARALPLGTNKVTFTSGTTGTAKGVCLGSTEMETVAESLRLASGAHPEDRHLAVLPLATLLENIGGIYVPLLAGATVCLPSLAEVGLSGSSGLDVSRLLAALTDRRATSAILVPQMLQALVAAGRQGAALPVTLRYLAVGGAPVANSLIDEAWRLGLPVHEGYGLSECASVVAVNQPGTNRPGCVGKPLPHVRLSFAADGEILVHGTSWRGYLGEAAGAEGEGIATGDLGHLDDDGYLHVTGRKKNMFITSFGRNVAPEWVESELLSQGPILQAAVFGEGRPYNCAVVVTPAATPAASIATAIAEANRRLPDYARVHAWLPARAAFSPANNQATPNGRLRRPAIFEAYGEQIADLYPSS